MLFFKNHEITTKLKKAFLVYLISGSRPISELIQPNRLDQKRAYENEFLGMIEEAISYADLEQAREELIWSISQSLDDSDKDFLMSFKQGNPNWSHFELQHIQDLPAIKWKQYNIQRMSSQKHQDALKELKRKLDFVES